MKNLLPGLQLNLTSSFKIFSELMSKLKVFNWDFELILHDVKTLNFSKRVQQNHVLLFLKIFKNFCFFKNSIYLLIFFTSQINVRHICLEFSNSSTFIPLHLHLIHSYFPVLNLLIISEWNELLFWNLNLQNQTLYLKKTRQSIEHARQNRHQKWFYFF